MLLNNYYNILSTVGTDPSAALNLLDYQGNRVSLLEGRSSNYFEYKLKCLNALHFSGYPWDLLTSLDTNISSEYCYIFLGRGTSEDSREFYTCTPQSSSLTDLINSSRVSRTFTFGENNLITVSHKIQFISKSSFTISELGMAIKTSAYFQNTKTTKNTFLFFDRTKISPITCSAGKSVSLTYDLQFRVLMPN